MGTGDDRPAWLRARRYSRRAVLVAPLAVPGMVGGRAMTAGSNDEIALSVPDIAAGPSLLAAIDTRRSVREFSAGTLSLDDVSYLCWAAQGVTDGGGLRAVPSAGALYPLECYLLAGAVSRVPDGFYHYVVDRHRLRLVKNRDLRAELAAAALDQDWLADAAVVLVLAAEYQRTTAKYGARGERYVHMEAGHAGQNVYLTAGALGLGTVMVGAFDDERARAVLDLPGAQQVVGLMPVGPHRAR